MKLIFTLIFTLFSAKNVFSQSEIKAFESRPTVCGEYLVSGVVRYKDGMKFIIHEKTLSQITISFEGFGSTPLGLHRDEPVQTNIVFTNKFDGNNILGDSITGEVKLRAQNILNPKDTGFQLVNPLPCKKL
ncbi:MAG: hypothetical protein K2Q18_06275 [Bdellovibrionales bacterium]|nr:hypothetical protein [Bdellovibrionales bacterium]